MVDAFVRRVVRLHAAWHAALLLVVCLLVYWPFLSESGLRSSEGLRVLPGWTILHTGEWFPTRLFETSYLRKPPGMPWAVAFSSWLLGETEFAARAVSAMSATLMSIIAWLFARRWFAAGNPLAANAAGLAAGLAQALLPRIWINGRTAEIEGLLCLTVQIAALFVVDLITHRRTSALTIAMAGVGIALSLLVKGPVGFPVIVGPVLAAALVARSLRTLVDWRWLTSLAVAALLSAAVAIPLLMQVRDEPTELESVGQFVWRADKLVAVLTFAPAVFVSALPTSVWVLFGWKPRVDASDCAHVARVVSFGFVAALLVYTAAGTWNPRYGMPAVVLVAPMVGYVAGAWWRGALNDFERTWARRLAFGSPVVMAVVLAIGVAVQLFVYEPRSAARSTRDVGRQVGRLVDHDAEVWSGAILNAKPELLHYARQEAAARGITLRPLWVSRKINACEPPPTGAYLILSPGEMARYEQQLPGRWTTLLTGMADDNAYVLAVHR